MAGYVDYVDSNYAYSSGMANVTSSGQVYMGVDSTNTVADDSRGRKSIRIASNHTYNGNNLFVIDLDHMPTTSGWLPSGCSVWPAYWLVGPEWPNNGEVDIIEYVNTQSADLTTLHTRDGCEQSAEDPSSFTGSWATGAYGQPATDCSVYASDQYNNQGCGINADNAVVGSAFNSLSSDVSGGVGGIYALEWVTDQYIRSFFFSRDNIPADLVGDGSDGPPQPDTWGAPYARFELGDSICSSDHFADNQIVFDTTFCGDWAGNTFASDCSTEMSCTDYVKYNPSDFAETYWLINYISVYELV